MQIRVVASDLGGLNIKAFFTRKAEKGIEFHALPGFVVFWYFHHGYSLYFGSDIGAVFHLTRITKKKL